MHTASVLPPLWALLPQQGIQVGIKAGVASCCAICLQHRQNHIAVKSTEHPPKGRQPRQAPWSGWCGVFLCSPKTLSLCDFFSQQQDGDEDFPQLSCQTRAWALRSHYHQIYFINISFTFHLFSLRTCHLDHAANRPFALLSLKHYIPVRKKKKNPDAEHLSNFQENCC